MFGLFADQQGCSHSHLLNTRSNNSSPLHWKVPRLQPMSSVETDTCLPHIWMKEAVAWNPPNLKSTIIFCFPSFFYFSKQHILPSSHQAEHIHLPASSLISLPHGDQSVKGSSVTALPSLVCPHSHQVPPLLYWCVWLCLPWPFSAGIKTALASPI